MDPYVTLKHGTNKWKSKPHDSGGKTPSWKGESFSAHKSNIDLIEIGVWDKDTVSDDDMIAGGSLSLAKF
jgi:hypothetical protein